MGDCKVHSHDQCMPLCRCGSPTRAQVGGQLPGLSNHVSMPAQGPCALCGKISMIKHQPTQLAVAFEGMGVEAIRDRLRRAGVQLHFEKPEAEVVCFKGGRDCYRTIRTALGAANAYTPRARRKPVGEVDVLESTSGRRVGVGAGGEMVEPAVVEAVVARVAAKAEVARAAAAREVVEVVEPVEVVQPEGPVQPVEREAVEPVVDEGEPVEVVDDEGGARAQQAQQAQQQAQQQPQQQPQQARASQQTQP